MGNLNITPAKHAYNTYKNFFKGMKESINEKVIDNVSVVDSLNYDFGIFIEDFIVNDDIFNKFNEEESTHCLGILLFCHFIRLRSIETKSKLDRDIKRICGKWDKGSNIEVYILKEIADRFQFCDESFYKWNKLVWEKCPESDVNTQDFLHDFEFKIDVSKLGVSLDVVDKAAKWIQSKLDETNATIKTVNSNDICAISKANRTNFNISRGLIPCHNVTVNVGDSSIICPKRHHLFNVRLPYNPIDETTDLVRSFVKKFKCDPVTFADNLLSWACPTELTITLVIGPSCSGKTTLCKVARSLYGPLVSFYNHEVCNSSYVRTCVHEDPSILWHRKYIRDHECSNLVINCRKDPEIGDIYQGRRVVRFFLNDSIKIHNQDLEIVTKVTTDKQLGSLLGWCLKTYDREKFRLFAKLDMTELLMLATGSQMVDYIETSM